MLFLLAAAVGCVAIAAWGEPPLTIRAAALVAAALLLVGSFVVLLLGEIRDELALTPEERDTRRKVKEWTAEQAAKKQ